MGWNGLGMEWNEMGWDGGLLLLLILLLLIRLLLLLVLLQLALLLLKLLLLLAPPHHAATCDSVRESAAAPTLDIAVSHSEQRPAFPPRRRLARAGGAPGTARPDYGPPHGQSHGQPPDLIVFAEVHDFHRCGFC